MTPHIIQLIHNFHDKCEDALTTEDYDSAKIWLEAADDTVEALGRELADECDCELEGEIELTPIGCVNIDNERLRPLCPDENGHYCKFNVDTLFGVNSTFTTSCDGFCCKPSLKADIAIDADGELFDLNRCHNPNCPCCVAPVYEVGCDCSKGDDVTTMSLIEVGSTLWQSGKDERRVIIKDDRGVIVASGELRVHDAEAFDGIRAK